MDDTTAFQSRRTNKAKQRSAAKVDPSFKSKRYRDKLRTEVKALESLVPIDRPALNRKLDSQTVYRLVIAYLRVKAYFKATGKLNEKAVDTDNKNHKHDEITGNGEGKHGTATPDGQQQKIDESYDVFEHFNFQQSLDGFALVLSIDGTIIFVTENIHQLLGFNQVDLIHRCFYGVIHPGDQAQFRDVLENNGEFSYPRVHMHTTKQTTRGKSGRQIGDSIPVSIYCRLKCFNRNSSGYSKFHCTGKLQDVPGILKLPKCSSRVAMLYCRPFLFTEGETTQETNQGMFWSKHDLDLKISATEDRITDVLGYQATDLSGTSLYQLVHPDDLCLLVHVHRTITELNEIQSFYLRLQGMGDNWVWLHSKGKVICKNSKKFSIVFTHTPLREDDSTFTDHETLLRQQYSSHNLMSLSKPPSSAKGTHRHNMFTTDSTTGQNLYGHLSCHAMKTPKMSLVNECRINNEITNILSQSELLLGVCPSTWHMSSERHSPVVPSSHMAHKLSFKDKHLQVLEKKQLQHDILHPPASVFASANSYTWGPVNSQSVSDSHVHTSDYICTRNGETNVPQYNMFQGYDPMMNNNREQFCYVGCFQTQPYNYPPSPPPSPRLIGPQGWHGCQPAGFPISNGSCGGHRDSNHSDVNSFLQGEMANTRLPSYRGSRQCQGHIQSHASIKVSMIYNSNINYTRNQLQTSRHGCHDNSIAQFHPLKNTAQLNNHIKPDPSNSQSCAVTEDFPTNPSDCKQFDIEASIHMRIVESEGKTGNPVAEVNLPVTDSFMDYLNN